MDAESISYNGTDISFRMSSDVDNPVIKVFAMDILDARPLAKVTEK